MAKVELYNARGLAKQAVGTPGIDPTGEIIERGGDTITELTGKYIAAENAKIKIADNILAETEKIKWENELYNQVEKAKQDPNNLNNPYGLADTIFNTAQSSAQSYAKNISNPRAREMFLEKSTNTVAQAQSSMRKWASDQTATNAYISVKEGIDAIRLQASKVGDKAGFQGVLSQGEALIVNATPVIGVENAYRLRQELRKGAAEDFIYSKIDGAPGTVKAYIDSGMFNGIYDEKEKLSIKKTAEAVQKRNEIQSQAATTLGANIRHQQNTQKMYDGQLTLKQANDEISYLKSLGVQGKRMELAIRNRDALVSKGGFRYATTNGADAMNQINSAFGLIEKKEGKKGKEAKISLPNASLHQLQSMQDMLDENGIYLRKDTRDKYQSMLNEAWKTHVSDNPYAKKVTGNLWWKQEFPLNEYYGALATGYSSLDRMYPSNSKEAKRIYSQYFNASYDRNKNKPGFNFNAFNSGILARTKQEMLRQGMVAKGK